MYIAARFFNQYVVGDEVAEPNPRWIEDGLVQLVESKEDFMKVVDESVEDLDPEKPKRGRVSK